MKINLKELKQKTVDSEDYSFNARFSDELLLPFRGRFSGPVNVELHVESTGKVFWAAGDLRTGVVFECARCLEEFIFPVNIELNFNIADTVYRNDFTEEEVVFVSGDELDITSYLEEEILLSLPMQPLCDENCQGLCAGCGANLNLESCRCSEKEIDPRWEKLKQLKTGKEV
ncbi:uncharacterized protein SAMN02745221_01491 [Thermosyntropha lipolytica DSM 11003]|uniref:DUF177 domain-containing protein n=1 Tax=Thermosyntropha lipolytica DSM 11003 TaxID=1123382 RepID=A0A1M5PJ45_9FIRM|nr:DUF177 domain-containing protein [Thermosyntropha lipolytica]SHH01794.1 uncharacterized protein SAMN02745221_01491 [Thermosyntropha lipolytica DSM 11003]